MQSFLQMMSFVSKTNPSTFPYPRPSTHMPREKSSPRTRTTYGYGHGVQYNTCKNEKPGYLRHTHEQFRLSACCTACFSLSSSPLLSQIVGDKSSGSDGRGLGSSRVTRVEQFVARLKDMGVDRSVFERQFSRRRLVGLLNRSKHDMDTAVLRFFEDEHKLKEIEKVRTYGTGRPVLVEEKEQKSHNIIFCSYLLIRREERR